MKKTVAIGLMCMLTVLGLAVVQETVRSEAESDLTLAEPQPLIDTYDLMELIVDPTYELLKDACATEPEGRREWRAIYVQTYVMGELANLLFSRHDQDYMTTPEWDALTVEMRQLCENIGAASKQKDYAGVKKNYEALIANCNACHVQFEPDDAPEVKVWD